MSHTYTPDPDHNPTTTTLPDDGDDEDAASVNTPLEDVADKAAYTQKHYPLDTTYTVDRVQTNLVYPVTADNAAPATQQWFLNPGSAWTQTDVTVAIGASIYQELDLPDGCVLQNVFVRLKGETAVPHSALPAQLPQARVFKVNAVTGVSTALSALTTDPAATQPIYDGAHEIPIFSIGATVDRTSFRYLVKITGESGANAQAGLQLLATLVQFQVTKLDKGAA